MTTFFDNYTEKSNEFFLAQNMRKSALNELVSNMLHKMNKPYIEFTDETSYPYFYDVTIEEYESVCGAKIQNNQLYLCLTTELDEPTNWFNWEQYGTIDMEDFVNILYTIAKDNSLV